MKFVYFMGCCELHTRLFRIMLGEKYLVHALMIIEEQQNQPILLVHSKDDDMDDDKIFYINFIAMMLDFESIPAPPEEIESILLQTIALTQMQGSSNKN